MSLRSIGLSGPLHAYLIDESLREPAALAALRAETAHLPQANWQIAPEQGQFMALLVQLTGARRILEIGTFTGYSALAMALALPAGGEVLCCELSPTFADVARRHWRQAGAAERIALRLGPALDTLAALRAEGREASFDMAFIDADKSNYTAYFEACLALVRPGGLICIDNVLWGGRVIDPVADDEDTCAIRSFNRSLKEDPRVDIALVPIGDGLTLARKR